MISMTLDDLQNGYYIYQSENGFRFGVDAVLLSDFHKGDHNDKVLDICSGNGIIPILLAAKKKGARITGLEIQEAQVEIARRSIEYNSLSDTVNMICGDVKDFRSFFATQEFDAVTCNPPYMKAGAGKAADDSARAIARHEILCNFDDICAAAAWALKIGGRLSVVHRPQRCAELIRTMSSHGLEPKRIRFGLPSRKRRLSYGNKFFPCSFS